MAITVSSRKTFSISRDNGATWVDFPKLPSNNPMPVPSAGNSQLQRLDGTKSVPMFYDLQIEFNLLTANGWLYIANTMYSSANQVILLNYRGVGYTIDGAGRYQENWYYAPAIWADLPTATPYARLYKNCVVNFTMVEYYIPA